MSQNYCSDTKKNLSLSVVHVFEPFLNEELGRNIRQAHRQNYRLLAIQVGNFRYRSRYLHNNIQYPNIDINVNYVYPIDDKADGHFDIYKHDFWDYPWPQALGWFTSGFLESGTQIMAHKLYVPKLYEPKFMGFYLAEASKF